MTKLVPGILRNLERQGSESESDEDEEEDDEEPEDEGAQAALAQEIESRRIVRVKGAKR